MITFTPQIILDNLMSNFRYAFLIVALFSPFWGIVSRIWKR